MNQSEILEVNANYLSILVLRKITIKGFTICDQTVSYIQVVYYCKTFKTIIIVHDLGYLSIQSYKEGPPSML